MANKKWSTDGVNIHPVDGTNIINNVPPAIYQPRKSLMGWYLEKIYDKFVFPYKIYGTHSHILDRINRTWHYTEGNLGILLNGLKGTGKSITLQLIANKLVENNIPVIIINHPIDFLNNIVQALEQDCVLIFDEFEKTHDDEQQQAILSILDGMTKNKYKRMYLFSTNQPNINENLVDRPSRIRYCYTFGNLSKEVIFELIDDILDPELSHYKTDLCSYILSRKVISIDAAKTAIQEVNIHRESPKLFEKVLNLKRKEFSGYDIIILDENGEDVETFAKNFKCSDRSFNAIMADVNYARQRVEDYTSERNGAYLNFTEKTKSQRIAITSMNEDGTYMAFLGKNGLYDHTMLHNFYKNDIFKSTISNFCGITDSFTPLFESESSDINPEIIRIMSMPEFSADEKEEKIEKLGEELERCDSSYRNVQTMSLDNNPKKFRIRFQESEPEWRVYTAD